MKVVEFKKRDEVEEILNMALADTNKAGDYKHIVVVGLRSDDSTTLWATVMPVYLMMGLMAVASHEMGLIGSGVVDADA